MDFTDDLKEFFLEEHWEEVQPVCKAFAKELGYDVLLNLDENFSCADSNIIEMATLIASKMVQCSKNQNQKLPELILQPKQQ